MFTLAGDGVATGVTGVDVADGWGHFGVGGDLHSEKETFGPETLSGLSETFDVEGDKSTLEMLSLNKVESKFQNWGIPQL